ncbi:MAG TPA: FAD binding domain-containing protein [Candidatus Acidoferrales bacterium]|nr:FAD binding domain-containing protein [Candidatus Acidoferrales bacterium]
MSLPEFQLLRPRTIAEACEMLAKHADEIQIVAGGTDLIPSLRQRLFEPKFVLDIRGIAEIRGIRRGADGVEIGALTSLTAIEHSDAIAREYPVLAEAAATVASPVLRNMGTIGGNICLDTRCLWYNQSLTWRKSCGFCIKKDGDLCHVAPGGTKCWAAFSADTPPALLCLGAEIEIANANGVRRVPLDGFYTGEGEARMKLAKDELLTRVFLPARAAGWRGAYRKLRVRGSIDYPLAGIAVAYRPANGYAAEARVALTAVNPAPVLVRDAERLLSENELTREVAGAAGDIAARTAKPLTTSALTPEYRREMVRVLTKRALMEVIPSKK